jgi:hypothetical protein
MPIHHWFENAGLPDYERNFALIEMWTTPDLAPFFHRTRPGSRRASNLECGLEFEG